MTYDERDERDDRIAEAEARGMEEDRHRDRIEALEDKLAKSDDSVARLTKERDLLFDALTLHMRSTGINNEAMERVDAFRAVIAENEPRVRGEIRRLESGWNAAADERKAATARAEKAEIDVKNLALVVAAQKRVQEQHDEDIARINENQRAAIERLERRLDAAHKVVIAASEFLNEMGPPPQFHDHEHPGIVKAHAALKFAIVEAKR